MIMVLNRNFLLTILFALIFSINIFSQDQIKLLDKYLTEYFENKNIPSISAGVLYKGKILWLGTKGYADLENSVLATKKSVYRIASISKSITAVAVMQLVEQGKINLDEDVRKYIPYFSMKNWKFTVRQVLSHTSGVRNYRSEKEFNSKEYYKSTSEAVSVILNDTIEYEPGTKQHYTTLGYNLLAAIIENVSKMSFTEYLQEFIFRQAGMTSTLPDIQKEIIKARVKGYEKNNFRVFQNVPLADLSIKIPGGGLLSSAEDLLKFSHALLDGKLIKLSTLDSMITPTRLKNGEFQNYGLGFAFGTDEKGRKYIFHPGTGTGFSSLLLIYPQEKFAAVHLINSRDRNIGNPAVDFASIIIDKKYEKPLPPISDHLLKIAIAEGIDSAISNYKKIKTDSLNKYIINEDEMMLFGYDLISINETLAAIKFFRFFLKESSAFAKGYKGLADAYYRDGNRGLSIRNYRKALEFDPGNKYIFDMIKKLAGN